MSNVGASNSEEQRLRNCKFQFPNFWIFKIFVRKAIPRLQQSYSA